MKKGVRYLFGRLNIIPVREQDEKRKLLLAGLTQKALLETRGTVWGFYQIRELQSEYGEFIHGFLVKYKPETVEEVAIPETGELDEQAIRNLVRAKARFFLHISSGLLAYHSVAREIRRDVFADRFVRLFQKALGNFFVDAEIQTIEEPYRILDAIKNFRRISAVSIYLHPSNPNLRHIWKPVDDRLKQLEAATYAEKFDAKSEGHGLNVAEDEDVNSKISMAEDGYGRAEVTGTLNEEIVTLTTGDSPITAYSGVDDESPESVLQGLSATIKRVFARFNG